MSGLKNLLKYTPPDFRNFSHPDHGFPRGFLNAAWSAIYGEVSDGYERSQAEWQKGPESFVAWPSRERGCSENDLVSMYGGLGKADDMLTRLEAMDPKEREKHIKLDSNCDYDKLILKYAEFAGVIAAWELKGGDLYQTVLNGLLKRRIDEWEQEYLPNAAKWNFKINGEPMESVGDYCEERSLMEYAAVAIRIFRTMGYETTSDPRLMDLPYFDTYVERLKTSDETFRKILNGRRDIEAWADPTFWWHRPASADPKERKKRSARR